MDTILTQVLIMACHQSLCDCLKLMQCGFRVYIVDDFKLGSAKEGAEYIHVFIANVICLSQVSSENHVL